MSVEKKPRIVTRDMPGAWNVKYKWQFEAGVLKKYLAGLKEKKILGLKCPECGRVYAPPSSMRCGKCFVAIDEYVEVKHSGKVMMYTAVFTTMTGQPLPEPKITAMIQLDGANSWILAPMGEIKPEEMRTDLPVKVVWAPELKGEMNDILYFAPIK